MILWRIFVSAGLCLLVAAATPAGAQEVDKLSNHIDWSLYTDGKSPHQFCFLTSEPKLSEPADAARDAPRIYVSAWPKEGVKGEVSIRLGFPPKKNTPVSIAVNNINFKLFNSDDRAYVEDATQELKLLEAMKKGTKLVATATSSTGTVITDTYSLSGLGQAMQELQSTCF